MPESLDQLAWNADGLMPVIVQDHLSGEVLMFAWMNREAFTRTVELGEAVYWSRSRQRLWHKGESSGHTQRVRDIYVDCDSDVLLLKVEQVGGIACHTGRASCFFRRLDASGWQVQAPVLKDPGSIYGTDGESS